MCGMYRHVNDICTRRGSCILPVLRHFYSTQAGKTRAGFTPKRTGHRKSWQPVIGIEVHAQIASKSKLFSDSSTDFSGAVNSQVALFDAAIPGTLPVLNQRCVEAGILTALALNCTVNKESWFDRKHYFYADLPTGYQVTQQNQPLATSGFLDFNVCNVTIPKKIYRHRAHIKQLQLEQDSGKSLHDAVRKRSLIDLNRAGIALMEIVFEPDLRDGEEASALIKELLLILRRLGTCDCKMEEGSLRVDANVSVCRPGEPLGIRTEVKNLNSIRSVNNAIEFEIDRQIALLENDGVVVNETRAFDATNKVTVPMRDKEVKQDYRYMPEPNLPPLHLVDDQDKIKGSLLNINNFRRKIPELPNETRQKLIKQFGVKSETAVTLVNDDELLHYFMDVMKQPQLNPTTAANIIIMDLLTFLNKNNLKISECPVKPEVLAKVIHLQQEGIVTTTVAKMLLETLFQGDVRSPKEIVEVNNWTQLNDVEKVEKICMEVLRQNEKIVEQYRQGKKKAFNALVGLAKKAAGDHVNLDTVSKILRKKLDA